MEKVVAALQRRRPLSGDALVAGNPSLAVSPAEAEALISGVVQTAPAPWRDALAAFLRYEATRARAGAERLPLLAAYVRALARAAGGEPLWAATLLRRNCQVLTRACVAVADRAAYDDAAAAARQAFRITVSDAEGEEPQHGRTRECYAVAVCLLVLYVRMRAYSLAEGILQAIAQYRASIPPLSDARWHTQLVFLFHEGLLLFTKQQYVDAAARFDSALAVSKELKAAEFEHLMAFHIPAKFLAHNQAPTAETWAALPRLAALYSAAITSCRRGDVAALRSAIAAHRPVLVQQRVLLAFESMVPRAVLNLLRRTWLAAGRPRRLDLALFTAALRIADVLPVSDAGTAGTAHGAGTAADAGARIDADTEAAEFYVAQLICEGKVKGYIHHELQLIMLSGSRPFPTLVRGAAA